MTDTIPPCPVCGTVPQECGNTVACITCDTSFMNVIDWRERCEIKLGRALRASGITTIAQLTERLNDPRVAVLDMIGIDSEKDISILVDGLSTLLQGENAKTFHEDLMRKINIAAQRGEG